MSSDTPKTTEDHYSSAIGHGQLTVDLARRTPADYIIASGMSGARLGAALINLRTEYDSAARPVYKPGDTPSRHDAAMLDFYRRLNGYKQTYLLLVDQAKGRINTHIPAALAYWLASNCTACTGRGLEITPGTARLSGRHCKACAGTGTKPMTSNAVREVLNIMDAAIRAHKGSMAQKLTDKKFDENVARLP